MESITWLQPTNLPTMVSFKVLQFHGKFCVKKLIHITSIKIQPKWGAKNPPFLEHFQQWPTSYTSLSVLFNLVGGRLPKSICILEASLNTLGTLLTHHCYFVSYDHKWEMFRYLPPPKKRKQKQKKQSHLSYMLPDHHNFLIVWVRTSPIINNKYEASGHACLRASPPLSPTVASTVQCRWLGTGNPPLAPRQPERASRPRHFPPPPLQGAGAIFPLQATGSPVWVCTGARVLTSA